MSGEGPPEEKKAASQAGDAARSSFPGSAETGSCLQGINFVAQSQFCLASFDEAVGIVGLQLPEYPFFQDWRTLFASDRQEAYLAKFGVDASLAFRGHANLLIDKLRERRSKGLPRFRDVIELYRRGVEHPEKLSWDEAQALIEANQGGEHVI